MAEAAFTEDQGEVEAFEDEFGEIIKARSGKNPNAGRVHQSLNVLCLNIDVRQGSTRYS